MSNDTTQPYSTGLPPAPIMNAIGESNGNSCNCSFIWQQWFSSLTQEVQTLRQLVDELKKSQGESS